MAIGSAISIGIWTDQHWLVQLLLAFIIIANFFMAYKLRDMQNIGTSWIFVLIYLLSLLISTIVNFIAAVDPDCTNHKLLASGLMMFVILQSVTVIMLFTVRQNSLDNYKKLPIWFLTFGQLFQLSMLSLLVY